MDKFEQKVFLYLSPHYSFDSLTEEHGKCSDQYFLLEKMCHDFQSRRRRLTGFKLVFSLFHKMFFNSQKTCFIDQITAKVHSLSLVQLLLKVCLFVIWHLKVRQLLVINWFTSSVIFTFFSFFAVHAVFLLFRELNPIAIHFLFPVKLDVFFSFVLQLSVTSHLTCLYCCPRTLFC